MFAHDHVVAYLYEVVELHAATDDGRTHRGAVDAGIGSYLHVVLHHDVSYLGYLAYSPFSSGAKPKPSAPMTLPRG